MTRILNGETAEEADEPETVLASEGRPLAV
jgi:hypothetical protein